MTISCGFLNWELYYFRAKTRILLFVNRICLCLQLFDVFKSVSVLSGVFIRASSGWRRMYLEDGRECEWWNGEEGAMNHGNDDMEMQ